MHIDDDQFAKWTKVAITLLPPRFREALDNIAIDVESTPSPQTKRKIGLRRGQVLFGLYVGVPLTQRDTNYGVGGAIPDKIVLYKENIERFCRTPEEVRDQLVDTLFHEVGHYFDMNEAQLREIEFPGSED